MAPEIPPGISPGIVPGIASGIRPGVPEDFFIISTIYKDFKGSASVICLGILLGNSTGKYSGAWSGNSPRIFLKNFSKKSFHLRSSTNSLRNSHLSSINSFKHALSSSSKEYLQKFVLRFFLDIQQYFFKKPLGLSLGIPTIISWGILALQEFTQGKTLTEFFQGFLP